MRKSVPLVAALIISLGAHAQESETVLYERLGSLASEVVTEYLNGSLCAPGPNLAKTQVKLAEAVSQATPSTGPLVLDFAAMANSPSNVRRLHEGGADVNAMDTSGGSVIRHSLACGDQAVVDLLLRSGAVPSSKDYEAAQRLGILLVLD